MNLPAIDRTCREDDEMGNHGAEYFVTTKNVISD